MCKRRRGEEERTALIKPNNPHLAGGESRSTPDTDPEGFLPYIPRRPHGPLPTPNPEVFCGFPPAGVDSGGDFKVWVFAAGRVNAAPQVAQDDPNEGTLATDIAGTVKVVLERWLYTWLMSKSTYYILLLDSGPGRSSCGFCLGLCVYV